MELLEYDVNELITRSNPRFLDTKRYLATNINEVLFTYSTKHGYKSQILQLMSTLLINLEKLPLLQFNQ